MQLLASECASGQSLSLAMQCSSGVGVGDFERLFGAPCHVDIGVLSALSSQLSLRRSDLHWQLLEGPSLHFLYTTTTMPPRKGASAEVNPVKDVAESTDSLPKQGKAVDITLATITKQPLQVIQALLCDRRYFFLLASLLAIGNLLLGAAIILRVPCMTSRD